MNQYDIILVQNTLSGSVDFAEKTINLDKGELLSAESSSQVPTVLGSGSHGYILSSDTSSTTGLSWIPNVTGSTSVNSTTDNTFTVDSDSITGKLILQAGLSASDYSMTLVNEGLSANRTLYLPNSNGTLATQTYANDLFASNDAMIFKGTIGIGGTYTSQSFDALTTYNAGWTWRVITTGSIRGNTCEVGDLVMAIVDRTGSGNLDADFTVAQANIDGAVIGPASVTDNYVAVFDGATGKLIKAGSGSLGSAAYSTSESFASIAQGNLADSAIQQSTLNANSVLYAITDNTPAALAMGASTILARLASGDIVAASTTQIRTLINVADGATANATASAATLDAGTNNTLYATALALSESVNIPWAVPGSSGSVMISDGSYWIASPNISADIIIDGTTNKAYTATEKTKLALFQVSAPSTTTDTGTTGQTAYDSNYLYQCVNTNTWRRTALASW